MKRSIIILWIATILAIVFFGLTQRYTIVGTTKASGYKLDKLTGKVWFLYRAGQDQKLVPPVKEQKKK